MNMDGGGAYGAGKATGHFDCSAYVRKPQVILRAVSWVGTQAISHSTDSNDNADSSRSELDTVIASMQRSETMTHKLLNENTPSIIATGDIRTSKFIHCPL